jgi:outer membrane receptor protein involved in Fe transport
VEKFPAVAVFSPRADFSYKNFGLSLVVNNVFNKKYLQGGSSNIPVCQKGRWLMLTAKYRF